MAKKNKDDEVRTPLTREERETAKKTLAQRRANLTSQLAKIEEEEEQIRQDELREKKVEAAKKIEYLRENRDFVLSLLQHDRSSCDDDHVVNGYGYDSRVRCRKCFLIELLNGEWGSDWNVEFSVDITPIE